MLPTLFGWWAGLGMLLWQAAPGFARWFGVEVTEDDVAAARALIEDDLKKEQG